MAHATRTGTKPFMKKHQRFFGVFGALIVFLTFVIKEGKEERFKETVASLASAGAAFSIAGGQNRTQTGLREIKKEIKILHEELGHPQLSKLEAIGRGLYSEVGIQDVLDRTRTSIAICGTEACLSRERSTVRTLRVRECSHS